MEARLAKRLKGRVLLLLLFLAGVVYALHTFREPEKSQLGKEAPLFELPSRDRKVGLAEFRGQVVLLNFWASWCPPCAAEMPSLENLAKEMKEKDFAILAVSIDEGWKEIDRFLAKNPVSLTILLDSGGEVASTYGTHRLPESYLIDKEGKVVQKYLGPREWVEPKIVEEVLSYVERH